MNDLITILTPSYNRGSTLDRLYCSLQMQTSKSFEWIIVNDGSIDQTEEKIKKFQTEKTFKVSGVSQKNQGKASAINKGCKLANGEYIFIVDSDDCLTPDAIESISSALLQAHTGGRNFSGVGFRKCDFQNKVSGIALNSNDEGCSKYLNATDAANLLKGEMALCFKKELMLKYTFPSFPGEKFVPEGLIWTQITDVADILFYINKYIYLYEYLDDGLTSNFKTLLKKNPKGFSVYYYNQIKREKSFFNKLKMLIRFFQCKWYVLIK